MTTAAFHILAWSVLGTSSPSYDLEVQYRLRAPAEALRSGILPSAIDIVAPLSGDHRRIIRSGYDQEISVLNPQISVLLEDNRPASETCATRRNERAAQEFARLHDVGVDQTDPKIIEERRLELLRERQIKAFDRKLLVKEKGKLNAKILGDQVQLSLQLNGFPVLFPQVLQNHRMEINVDRADLLQAQIDESFKIRMSIDIGAVKLQPWQADWNKLRYRFFVSTTNLLQRTLQTNLPAIMANQPDEYLKKIARQRTTEGFVPGMSSRRNMLGGFLLSTCVEFQDFEDEDFVDFDPEELCWLFDKRQAGKLLPLLVSESASHSTYLLERELHFVNGDSKLSHQLLRMAPSFFVDLNALEW